MNIKISITITFLTFFFLLIAYQLQAIAQPACISDIETAEINKTTLHYIECGTGEPLVLVHGSLGDYRTWIHQVGPFSQKYRVISYSRRYHYPNPWPNDPSSFSAEVHAKDLAVFIQTLDLDKVHLVGHSWGALTSLLIASDHPELIRSLTLGEAPAWSLIVDSSEGKSLFQSFRESATTPSHEAFENGNIEDGVRLFINGVLGEKSYGKSPPISHIFMLENARGMKGEMAEMANQGLNFYPLLSCDDVKQITVPTLLLDGENSPKFLRLTNDNLERCLPNNERAVIPGASHDLKIHIPSVFSEKVLSFLDRY